MPATLSLSLAIALLALLVTDIFMTVFHAQGRAGFITRWHTRATWTLFRRLESRAARSFAAPFMVVHTLALWALLFVVGYAFIYYPFIPGFLASPGSLRAPAVEALYFSGIAGATLGTGDIVPDLPALRLVSVLQAFSGFALISVSISYLLATYRELIAMRALAQNISGWLKVNDAASVIDTHPEAMARWCEQVQQQLLHVLHAHFQYPILHYFQPQDPDAELPAQLHQLLQLRHATSAQHDTLHQHPSFRALFASVDDYVEDVARHFVPGRRADPHDPAANLRAIRAWTRSSDAQEEHWTADLFNCMLI